MVTTILDMVCFIMRVNTFPNLLYRLYRLSLNFKFSYPSGLSNAPPFSRILSLRPLEVRLGILHLEIVDLADEGIFILFEELSAEKDIVVIVEASYDNTRKAL